MKGQHTFPAGRILLTLCVYFIHGQSIDIQEFIPPRELQEVMERFQIGESRIVFSGDVIQLIYPLNDLVAEGSVSTTLFSDDDCSIDILENDYLVPSIVYDENPNPSGTKNREVIVRYDVDPVKIQETEVWQQDESNQFFIAFCMGLYLHDGDAKTEPEQASIDTLVRLQVDLIGDFGAELPVNITDPAAFSAFQKYFVKGYICDDNLEEVLVRLPLTQGDNVRVCVVPEEVALLDGVLMRRIDSFAYIRQSLTDGNTILQEAVRDGATANDVTTELFCERGSEMCYFDTVLRSDFFFSRGEVYGFGEAWLQYGKGTIRKLQFSVRTPPQHRVLQDVDGGFAGASGFNLRVVVAPEDTGVKYGALAYQCDEFNRKIKNPVPKRLGSSIRICVTPDEAAMDYSMTINRIDSFNWTRSEVGASQVSVDVGGNQTKDGLSIVVCVPDATLCIFRTHFKNDFYQKSDGTIKGVGGVVMQYGLVVQDETSTSRRNLASDADGKNRKLQISSNSTNRIVGVASVSVDVRVARQEDSDLPAHCDYDQEITSWWKEMDSKEKFRFIGIAVGTLLGMCCPFLMCLLCPCRRDEEEDIIEEDDQGNIKVNVDVSNEKDGKKVQNVSSQRSLDTTDVSDGSKERYAQLVIGKGDEEPGKNDVCFGDPSHAGTRQLINAIKKYQKDSRDEKFGPHSYRIIKKELGDARYFSLDSKGRYVEASKNKSIPLMGELYVQIKNGKIKSSEDIERATGTRTKSETSSSQSLKKSSSKTRLR